MTSTAIEWTGNNLELTGATAVVTGGTSGIGLALTDRLGQHGKRVLVGARDVSRLTERPAVEVGRLDLADADSVRSFAAWVSQRAGRLDLLVNNAGVSNQPFQLTSSKVESQFAVNHLGHFALTGVLLPLLSAADHARVVTISSELYSLGQLDLSQLSSEQTYTPGGAYVRSKLANVLFATELARRLRRVGSPVRSLVAHPGLARTPMHNTYPSPETTRAVHTALAETGREPTDAIVGILYAATAAAAEPDTLYGPVADRSRPHVGAQPLVGAALDGDLARSLWATSAELSGVHYLGS